MELKKRQISGFLVQIKILKNKKKNCSRTYSTSSHLILNSYLSPSTNLQRPKPEPELLFRYATHSRCWERQAEQVARKLPAYTPTSPTPSSTGALVSFPRFASPRPALDYQQSTHLNYDAFYHNELTLWSEWLPAITGKPYHPNTNPNTYTAPNQYGIRLDDSFRDQLRA
jgi:hypothetical protein